MSTRFSSCCVVVAVLLTSRASAEPSDLGAALLEYGPYEVGYVAFELVDPDRDGRIIPVGILYPAGEVPTDAAPAVIPQYFPPLADLCGIHHEPFCGEFDVPITGRVEPTIDAEDLFPGTGRLFYDAVAVAEGEHPMVVQLPGGGGSGQNFIPSLLRMASHGFVAVYITPGIFGTAPAGVEYALDAEFVIGALADRNDDPEDPFYGRLDLDAVFGLGHSIGGQAWMRHASHFGRDDDYVPLVRGIIPQDGTREFTDPAIFEEVTLPTFLNSQFCRDTQIELQQRLGYHAMRLTLPPFPGAHNLFHQTCQLVLANDTAGNDALFALLFDPALPFAFRCTNQGWLTLERFYMEQTTRYNLAWMLTMLGDTEYEQVLAPGQVHQVEGVYLARTAIGEGDDEAAVFNAVTVQGAEGFCTQPGSQDPGSGPIIQIDDLGF